MSRALVGAGERWKQGDLADFALVGARQRSPALLQVLLQLAQCRPPGSHRRKLHGGGRRADLPGKRRGSPFRYSAASGSTRPSYEMDGDEPILQFQGTGLFRSCLGFYPKDHLTAGLRELFETPDPVERLQAMVTVFGPVGEVSPTWEEALSCEEAIERELHRRMELSSPSFIHDRLKTDRLVCHVSLLSERLEDYAAQAFDFQDDDLSNVLEQLQRDAFDLNEGLKHILDRLQPVEEAS